MPPRTIPNPQTAEYNPAMKAEDFKHKRHHPNQSDDAHAFHIHPKGNQINAVETREVAQDCLLDEI